MAPCVKPAIRAIPTCRCSWREPDNLLQYFTWSIAWHCQNFAKSRSEGHFNRWGSSESSNTRPFSIPTLTSSESVHLKLHEMYLQSNSSLLFITHVIYGWMYSKLDQVVLRNSPVMWCLTSAPDCNDVYFSMRGEFSRGGLPANLTKCSQYSGGHLESIVGICTTLLNLSNPLNLPLLPISRPRWVGRLVVCICDWWLWEKNKQHPHNGCETTCIDFALM